jgi:uncharacterized protein involved in exopolysaccharide biosynthesis
MLGLAYALLCPSYPAEMKVLVRRGRIDPVAAPTPSLSPQFATTQVAEDELNSEAEMLRDEDILRQVVRSAGLQHVKASWFWAALGQTPDEQTARAVRQLGKKLDVQPGRKTSLITVTYASGDPTKSAKVLQCLATAYLQRHQEVRRPSGEVAFFEQQAAQAEVGLEQAEMELMDFVRERGTVSAATQRDLALQDLSLREHESQQTQIEISETAQRIKTLQDKLVSLPERMATESRTSDNPELMQTLKSRLLELRLKRTELLAKYGASYRLVQEVDEQIEQAQAALQTEEQSPVREQASDLDPNHEWARSELLKSQVELSRLLARNRATGTVLTSEKETARQLGDDAIAQERLLENLKAAEEKYLLYANKREEARIGDALDEGGILNVTIAEAPAVPVLPSHSAPVVACAGLFMAAVCGCGAGFAADQLNSSFRHPDDVLRYLGAPVLASLPRRDA